MKLFESTFIKALLTISVLSVSTQVFASGSYSGGGNSGFQHAYNLGKSVLYRKVTCETCPIPESSLNKEKARHIIEKLNADETVDNLKTKEKKAVIYYLERRFNLG